MSSILCIFLIVVRIFQIDACRGMGLLFARAELEQSMVSRTEVYFGGVRIIIRIVRFVERIEMVNRMV